MGARHVLVVFHDSRSGRTALADAAAAARESGARLTALVLAPTESPSPCCNQQTTFWNAELRRLAAEDVERARELLSDVEADFVVSEDDGRQGVARAAAELG